MYVFLTLCSALAAPSTEDLPPATVLFDATAPTTRLARVVGRGSTTGAVGNSMVTVNTTYTEDLCRSPCTVEITPGFHEFVVQKKMHLPTKKEFELRPGETYQIHAKMGSSVVRRLGWVVTVIGAAAILSGGILLVEDRGGQLDASTGYRTRSKVKNVARNSAVVGGGVAITAGGIAMMLASRSKLEQTPVSVSVAARF